jgi:lysophospholipase L1-like esterase
MVEEVTTAKGEIKTETFVVNVRTPIIDKETSIRRKPREMSYLNWDEKLTLEFNNTNPSICGIEIKKVENATTIFLTGNSTVVDQEREPWAAWGQMLPVFFNKKVAIANYAESGEAMKSFIAEKRLMKISTQIKKGDYLFIQFGHNDQKPQSSAYLEPFTGYKEYLKIFINEARKHGANPVLITSMNRRSFNENGELINTHGDYPEAARQVAKEENVPLIDLHLMSKAFYEALGVENSKKAFVHYPAGSFPGQTEDFKDNSHHSTYGSYQLAKCIVQGIKDNNLDLAKYLKHGIPDYNPASPDSFKEWDLPISPLFEAIKPDGN